MSLYTEKKVSRLKRSGAGDMKLALSKCSIQDGVGGRGEGRGEGGGAGRTVRRHSVSSSVTTSSVSSTISGTSRTSRTSTSSSTFSSASSRNSEGNIRNNLSRDVLEKIGNRQLKIVNETKSKLKFMPACQHATYHAIQHH